MGAGEHELRVREGEAVHLVGRARRVMALHEGQRLWVSVAHPALEPARVATEALEVGVAGQ